MYPSLSKHAQSLNAVTKLDAEALKVRGSRTDPNLLKQLRSACRRHLERSKKRVTISKVTQAVLAFMTATAPDAVKKARKHMLKTAEKELRDKAEKRSKT
eukprot:6628606-Pyramimonas_sp.AAC.1